MSVKFVVILNIAYALLCGAYIVYVLAGWGDTPLQHKQCYKESVTYQMFDACVKQTEFLENKAALEE